MLLSELFVMITGNMAPLNLTLMNARKALGAFVGFARSAFGLALAGSAGAGIGYALWTATQKAISLQETLNRVRVVFGDYSKDVEGFSSKLSSAFGISRKESLDAASQIGFLFRGAGMGAEQTAELSTRMVKLAGDIMSFADIPMDAALQKITAGLVGMERPLREVGIMIDEAGVEAKAAALGFKKVGSEYDQSAKTIARANLISEKAALINGDLERTANSSANQQRKFWGLLGALSVRVGSELEPAFNSAALAANRLMSALLAGWDNADGAVQKVLRSVRELTFEVAHADLVFQIATTGLALSLMKIQASIENVTASWGRMVEYIRTHKINLADVWSALPAGSGLGMLGRLLGGKTGQDNTFLGGVGAALNAPDTPQMAILRADLKRQMAELAKLRAQQGGGGPPKWPAPTPTPTKDRKADYLELAEFAKRIQTGAFGKDSASQTASNTQRLVSLTEQQVNLARRAAAQNATGIVGP